MTERDAVVKILAGMFRNAFMPETNRERALVLMRDEDVQKLETRLKEAEALLREHTLESRKRELLSRKDALKTPAERKREIEAELKQIDEQLQSV